MTGAITGGVIAVHAYKSSGRRVAVLNTTHISATNGAYTESRSAEHAKKQSENRYKISERMHFSFHKVV